jgi:hypothetical protein
MSLETGFWRIDGDATPVRIAPTAMDFEARLESILESDVSVISEPRKWMVIGRQVTTPHRGRIDLLALDVTGAVIVLELKRDKTDREVVSQVLDYASWVSELEYADLATIYSRYQKSEQSLEDAFQAYFGVSIPDEVNSSHEMVIAAAELHPESERVVRYLQSNYGVPVNAVFFNFFRDGEAEYLSRSWLVEPDADSVGEVKSPGRLNHEFYGTFGYPRDVVEAGMKFGFMVASGGDWYVKSFDLLSPGDRIWVHLGAGKGFGGVAEVVETRQPIDTFTVTRNGVEVPVQEVVSSHLETEAEDPDKAMYAVRLKWLYTVPYDKGVWEKGFLANQNTVARPTSPKWDYTVQRLKTLWGIE